LPAQKKSGLRGKKAGALPPHHPVLSHRLVGVDRLASGKKLLRRQIKARK